MFKWCLQDKTYNSHLSEIQSITNLKSRYLTYFAQSAPFVKVISSIKCALSIGYLLKRVNLEGEIVILTSLTSILKFWPRTTRETHCEYCQSFRYIGDAFCDHCGQLQHQFSNFEMKMRHLKFGLTWTFGIKMRWTNVITMSFIFDDIYFDLLIIHSLWNQSNNHQINQFDKNDSTKISTGLF